MEQLELRWHGHACFSLTCQNFTVVFDPYEDNYVPGFGPPGPGRRLGPVLPPAQ